MSSWKEGERGLLPGEVEYLVFEGGGGKGVLYKGAIQALEEENVIDPLGTIPNPDDLQHQLHRPKAEEFKPALGEKSDVKGERVKGIAGSSAGAITAVLLGMGFSSENLGKFLSENDFTEFLDVRPKHHVEPWPGVHEGNRVVRRDELVARQAVEELSGRVKRNRKLSERDRKKISSFKNRKERNIERIFNFIEKGIWWIILTAVEFTLLLLGVSDFLRKKITDGGTKRIRQYFNRMLGLYGLFSGSPAREVIDRRIALRVSRINEVTEQGVDISRNGSSEEDFRNITFKEYKDVFDISLALAGSNLTTGSSEVFSDVETPEFPVADAVRISMGIPFLFMPVQLLNDLRSPVETRSVDGNSFHREMRTLFDRDVKWNSFKGYWVDGGIFNNVPIRIFDELEAETTPTLGIRLDVPTQTEISGFVDFFLRTFLGMLGSSESHISESTRTENQTVALPTSSVSVLDFNVRPSEVSGEISRAKTKVRDYFKSAHRDALAPQPSPPIRP